MLEKVGDMGWGKKTNKKQGLATCLNWQARSSWQTLVLASRVEVEKSLTELSIKLTCWLDVFP